MLSLTYSSSLIINPDSTAINARWLLPPGTPHGPWITPSPTSGQPPNIKENSLRVLCFKSLSPSSLPNPPPCLCSCGDRPGTQFPHTGQILLNQSNMPKTEFVIAPPPNLPFPSPGAQAGTDCHPGHYPFLTPHNPSLTNFC